MKRQCNELPRGQVGFLEQRINFHWILFPTTPMTHACLSGNWTWVVSVQELNYSRKAYLKVAVILSHSMFRRRCLTAFKQQNLQKSTSTWTIFMRASTDTFNQWLLHIFRTKIQSSYWIKIRIHLSLWINSVHSHTNDT